MAANASRTTINHDYDLNDRPEIRTLIEDLRKRINVLERTNNDLLKTQDRAAFTLVLIDGDAMNFTDDLVREGFAGGEEAARRLLSATRGEIHEETDFKYHEKIIVKVYASFRGLSKTYVNKGILATPEDFADFVTGFSKVNEGADFIDAGNAKEGADRKMRANLDLFIYNGNCKRILLGACTDNTYASYLKAIYDYDVPSKVRLLKSTEFAFEFRSILHKYKQVEFPDIFRSEKLPSARNSPAQRAALPASFSKRKADSWDDRLTRYRKLDNTASLTDSSGPESTALVPTAISAGDLTLVNDALPQTDLAGSPTQWANTAVEDQAADDRAIALIGAGVSIGDVLPVMQTSSANEHPDVVMALIRSTFEHVAQSTGRFDYGVIKKNASQRLGLGHWFWDVRNSQHEWWETSNKIMRWTVENMIEHFNSLPPVNLTWLSWRFPPGTSSPAAVMADPSAQQWRIKGEDSWLAMFEEVAGAVSA